MRPFGKHPTNRTLDWVFRLRIAVGADYCACGPGCGLEE